MKFSTKQLAQTALLLAFCIASQFLKNLSVYITGPIVNTILIIAVLAVGLTSGIIIAVISPITAFLITGSPIMAAIPAIIPCIMLGNVILVLFTWLFTTKFSFKGTLPAGLVTGSIFKALFMGITISMILLPTFGTALPAPAQAVAKTTFSITQLITALIGSVLALLIWIPLKKSLHSKDL